MGSHILRNAIIVFLLVVGASIAYFVFVHTPKKFEYLKQQRAELDVCIEKAQSQYAQLWTQECKNFGRPQNCVLPAESVARIDQSLKDGKDLCFRKFDEVKEELDKRLF